MKRLLSLGLLLVLAGSGSKENLPFLGRWHADFVVDQMSQPGTAKDLKREGLHGYLQIYQTGLTFKLHLEGEQEAVDAGGTWSHQGRRVTLKFKDVKIDDMGGFEHRDPNLKFIAPTDLHLAYQREMILNLSADKQNLNGLEVTIGKLIGRHLFSRSLD